MLADDGLLQKAHKKSEPQISLENVLLGGWLCSHPKLLSSPALLVAKSMGTQSLSPLIS